MRDVDRWPVISGATRGRERQREIRLNYQKTDRLNLTLRPMLPIKEMKKEQLYCI